MLEPMHTLRVQLGERAGAELFSLKASSIHGPRLTLTGDLDRLQAAGRALRWLRLAVPARTPEPETWMEITRLLDRLDVPGPLSPMRPVAEFGITLVGAMGFALTLGRCVLCARPCDPGRSAYVDPARGGLVCRRCGGGGTLLPGPARQRIAQAGMGSRGVLVDDDVPVAIELVEAVLRSHVGVDPGP